MPPPATRHPRESPIRDSSGHFTSGDFFGFDEDAVAALTTTSTTPAPTFPGLILKQQDGERNEQQDSESLLSNCKSDNQPDNVILLGEQCRNIEYCSTRISWSLIYMHITVGSSGHIFTTADAVVEFSHTRGCGCGCGCWMSNNRGCGFRL